MSDPHPSSIGAKSRTVRRFAGQLGAVSTAHPLATAAGREILASGGTAADAAVAAQAALCVVLPQSCGLGGDGLVVVEARDGGTEAFHGAGATPAAWVPSERDDASRATVPGVVDAWANLSERHGRRPLAAVLAPAARLAEDGIVVDDILAGAVRRQRERLERGGAAGWALLHARPGSTLRQPELGAALRAIGESGGRSFYEGPIAEAIERAALRHGGAMTVGDLAGHRTAVGAPVEVRWAGQRVSVAPPPSQAALLAMALSWFEQVEPVPDQDLDHFAVELVLAAFGWRDRVAAGEALLDAAPPSIPDRATGRSGPRSFLHTAGVAVADRDGLVVSSLVSVFDSFGSATYVPEGGFVLNNRADGFTATPNDPAPGKRPVHTLSPIIVRGEDRTTALATPGADGQIQTLLQVLVASARRGADPASAIAAPRWRNEEGRLLIERSHPGAARLAELGHEVVPLDDGDDRFGAVVCAGVEGRAPFAASDWRRQAWSGVA